MFKYLKYMFMAALVSVAATGCQEDPEDAFSSAPTAPELVNNGKILMTQNTMSEDITWAWTSARFFSGEVNYTLYMVYEENEPVAIGTSKTNSLTVSKENFRTQLASLSYLPKNDTYTVNFYVNASDGNDSANSEKQMVSVYAYGDAVSAVATAAAEEIVLDKSTPSAEVVLLSWDAARLNYNETITYNVLLSYNGGESQVVASGLSTTSCSTTVDALNELAVTAGAPEEAASDIDFTVMAYSESYPNGVPSEKVTIKITTYLAIFPDLLYLPGNYQGTTDETKWKPATALTIKQSSSVKGLYEAFVDLTNPNEGDTEFKFCIIPDWGGDFGMESIEEATGKNGTVYYQGTLGKKNVKVASGFYYISVNKKFNTLQMVPVKSMGIIGDATPKGWDAETPMTYDAESNSYSVVINLTEGKEFKFRLNDNWDFSIGNDGTFAGKNFVMNQPTGEYKAVVKLDSHPFKVNVLSTSFPTEEYIYVPGNHVKDWNPELAPALKTSALDGVYEGFTYLNSEFKFTKYRNWIDGEYKSTDFDEFPEGFASATSNTNITCATAGHYYLKVDVMNRKLTADAIKDWGIIGSATPKGWDDETELTYNASEECWEGVVELVAGELKFRANHDSNWTYNFGGSIDNLTQGGADMAVDEAGTYEVKLYLSRSKSENIYCTLTLLK